MSDTTTLQKTCRPADVRSLPTYRSSDAVNVAFSSGVARVLALLDASPLAAKTH